MTAETMLEWVLQFVVVALIPIIGYIFTQERAARRTLFARYDSIRRDLTKAQLMAAREYMSKSEIRQLIEDAIEPIKQSLGRIEQNLNGK